MPPSPKKLDLCQKCFSLSTSSLLRSSQGVKGKTGRRRLIKMHTLYQIVHNDLVIFEQHVIMNPEYQIHRKLSGCDATPGELPASTGALTV
jgi:hypothetical protein